MSRVHFRSTALLSVRQRQVAPVIDRATFVIFSLGGRRLAAPVTAVERVLRGASTDGASQVTYVGRPVPVLDLRLVFGASASSATPRSARRLLVFSVQDVWVAADVDAVHEVATIDAAIVDTAMADPVDGDSNVLPLADADGPRGRRREQDRQVIGARGRFERHGEVVVVLDMLRVVRAVYDLMRVAADG